MAVHSFMKKRNAQSYAKKSRGKGYKASTYKSGNMWRVSVTTKKKR